MKKTKLGQGLIKGLNEALTAETIRAQNKRLKRELKIMDSNLIYLNEYIADLEDGIMNYCARPTKDGAKKLRALVKNPYHAE